MSGLVVACAGPSSGEAIGPPMSAPIADGSRGSVSQAHGATASAMMAIAIAKIRI
ncbi:hypothetical protein USDA257_c60660 [Sinorhizobium fredii USDA 257]|uniref:Uncharacterized protein n=1 Tax=Sinorhizobium fredii (strain USDA 257) TaxID=1185652 RepID=I3XFB2_SINF2|nr:hypothetical protein USDA257_c60660 [Sinorhizobium fredii USDA 257]